MNHQRHRSRTYHQSHASGNASWDMLLQRSKSLSCWLVLLPPCNNVASAGQIKSDPDGKIKWKAQTDASDRREGSKGRDSERLKAAGGFRRRETRPNVEKERLFWVENPERSRPSDARGRTSCARVFCA